VDGQNETDRDVVWPGRPLDVLEARVAGWIAAGKPKGAKG
jgi:hypothetical protein